MTRQREEELTDDNSLSSPSRKLLLSRFLEGTGMVVVFILVLIVGIIWRPIAWLWGLKLWIDDRSSASSPRGGLR